MKLINTALEAIFRAFDSEQKIAVDNNATPSPVLGAQMVRNFHIGEFASANHKGKFLLHAETVDGSIASCSLVTKTDGNNNTFELNGGSMTLRSGIPCPNEAPSLHGNSLQVWSLWCEVLNFYYPAGLPVNVVRDPVTNEFALRFPEQGSEKKRQSFVQRTSSVSDLLGSVPEQSEGSSDVSSETEDENVPF